MRAVIGVSKGVFSLEALVSTIVRLREEYGVDKFLLVTTRRSAPTVNSYVRTLKSFAPEFSETVKIDIVEVCDWTVDEDCDTERDVKDVLKTLLSDPQETLVVSFTPSSRRLAAAISIASSYLLCESHYKTRRERAEQGGEAARPRMRISHVDFLFGPWEGATYPYVPRPLEPLIEVISPGPEEPSGMINVARSFPDLEKKYRNSRGSNRRGNGKCGFPWTGRISELRCAVFELSRRMNAASEGASVIIRRGSRICGGLGEPSVLRVEMESDVLGDKLSFEIRDYCDPGVFREKVGLFARETCSFLDKLWDALGQAHRVRTHRRNAFRQLLYMSGLAMPQVIECRGRDCDKLKLSDKPILVDALKAIGKPLIVDANVVYAGSHNAAYQGVEILVPYCVFYEITAIYAESVKSNRYEYADPLLDMAAYLSLQETLSGRGELVGSPIAHRCEAAIPSIDPLVLSKSVLATRDYGAFNLWQIHPTTSNQTVLLLSSPNCEDAARIASQRDYGELFYYFLQMLVLLRLLSRGKIPEHAGSDSYKRFLRITLSVDGNPVEIPLAEPKR